MNKEILKNKYVKIGLIVVGFLLLSNILGYLLTGVAIAGCVYYFIKKGKGGELSIYTESQDESKSEVDQSFENMLEKIKKNRGI